MSVWWRIGVVALVATVANVSTAPDSTAEPAPPVLEVLDLTSRGLPPRLTSVEALQKAELAPAAASPGTSFAGFNAIAPQRVLDTRAGAPVGPDNYIVLPIGGVGSVPADAAAVVMNVTVVAPTRGGYVTVWPSGSSRPETSSLNMAAEQTVANLVVVKLGPDGAIRLYNNVGTTHLLGDVVAWARNDGHFVGLTPARVLDTRASLPVAGGAVIDVPVRGVGGVPPSGAGTVVVNITATRPTSPTYLTVWPTGTPRPNASSLNVMQGQTMPNLVFAPIGANGSISIFNERGNTDVLADVVGYIADGAAYVPLNPVRVMDTRTAFGVYGVLQDNLSLLQPSGRLGANQTFTLDLDNQFAASLDGSAQSSAAGFVFNVTAVDPSAPGYLTVYPSGQARPNVSSINVAAGTIVPNAVVVKPGPRNMVSIYNETGTVHVIVDLVGYIPLQNVLDTKDETAAWKFHVLYVQGSDSSANPATVIPQIRNEVEALDGWFALPAQSGRHLNIDRVGGVIEVTTIKYQQFTRSQLVNWEASAGYPALGQLVDDGYGNGQNRRWLVYFDGNRLDSVCGIRFRQFTTVFIQNACGTVNGSIPASAVGGSIGGQPNTAQVALHEMLHGLGAVPTCAPNYDDNNNPGHTSTPNDLMYWNAGVQPKFLDPGRNDYYGHTNTDCLDLEDSVFIAPAPPLPLAAALGS